MTPNSLPSISLTGGDYFSSSVFQDGPMTCFDEWNMAKETLISDAWTPEFCSFNFHCLVKRVSTLRLDMRKFKLTMKPARDAEVPDMCMEISGTSNPVGPLSLSF